MADIGETFVGFTGADYETLMGYQAIADYLEDKVTPITVEGVTCYIFNGSDFEFIELLEEEGLDETDYFTYFKYLKSTWNITGIEP